ncbi:hypothetical protein NEMBOFW57_002290 [Staphylotrichum longicolle]|uniref:Fe2OG dioxygenase domain-containing protein n=1 Tax=Staphylotrichum longicolle TaxID=669026 RepID=A0AAD4F3H1_9PEZI|nr:hypothetical protein NEMBOFW57_002290 [Staphylotrichum longicolle]
MPLSTSILPSFPEGLPLAPIATVSYKQLLDGNHNDASRVLEAAQTHGFFYLDLQGAPEGDTFLSEAEQLYALAKDAFASPLDEKLQFALERGVSLFGYKPTGTVKTTDRSQRPDSTEFICIAKDHLHGVTPSRLYPPPIEQHRPLLQSFTRHGHACGMLILRTLASRLGLAPDAFTRLNRFDQPSGDHCRLTHTGPHSADANNVLGLPSHTDFGSVTVLFNWLGGLQIESPSSISSSGSSSSSHESEWLWVQPLPGHAIVNLGDAMVTFTNGTLKSAKHRVVPPLGSQGAADRYSVVYFVRPHNDVPMRALGEFDRGSGLAAAAAAKAVAGKFSAGLEEGEVLTAGEWMRRRAVQLGN